MIKRNNPIMQISPYMYTWTGLDNKDSYANMEIGYWIQD